MLKKIILVLLIPFLAWAYQATQSPPPRICGSPTGPPITAPRIKLRDGRHLAYTEHGIPKEMAKYKIIVVHGFASSRHDLAIITSGITEELGAYLVSFDRPGYGESDPDPKRNLKSTALDIEELADQLELKSKFYVIGLSMGGQLVWGCLEYIPHRLAGATLISPVINYWWPGFPANLSAEAYNQQFTQDPWALRVAQYTPWLTYWWNTQKWFPTLSLITQKVKYSGQDLELMPKLKGRQHDGAYVIQEGEFDLKNPWVDVEGFVHLWHGDEDGIVSVTLQRYIAKKLPWVYYHELPGAGHLFPVADVVSEAILKALLFAKKQPVAWIPG
ncbi:unnamed protein product [Ilex paraguariensis]|uniref:AB hydrolase-1 domain-containing protein n=1 Tax=Ilex paraguariensis TaxID=185542 RepID=A0ABC8RW73_9AQUA